MKIRRILLGLLCLFLLGGCAKESRHYAGVEKQAQAWYRQKYGLKDVSVTDSFKAGNSGLFGYLDVKDRAYEMSDGFFVYWDDSEELFYDNRQAQEINRDFDEQILMPFLQNTNTDLYVSEYSLNRTGMESFDECVFRNYYDGDIYSYLKQEKPRPYELDITIRHKDGFDHEKWTASLQETLHPYLSGYMNVCVVNEDVPLETKRYSSLKDPDIVSYANVSFPDLIKWYRKIYIEILEGIYVCCDVGNVVFEAGDVVLEEAGPAIELQKILDEAYEAMPVDAEENKDGGYMVHDQRHESRCILNDVEIPYYRLNLSEKVMSVLDGDSRIPVFFRNDRSDGKGFYVHYGYGTSGSYSLFRVADCGEIEYDILHPDNLYYFGSYELKEYSDD